MTQDMTPSLFIKKYSSSIGKISSEAFLKAHENFLRTGELAEIAVPTLDKIQNGEITHSAGLASVIEAVIDSATMLQMSKTGKSVSVSKKTSSTRKKPAYCSVILDSAGNIVYGLDKEGNEVPLAKDHHEWQEAQGWVDRRLDENPNCHGAITSRKLRRNDGSVWIDIVKREDSIARLYKRKSGAVMKRSPQSTQTLGFGVKAKNDFCHFSRG